MRSSDQRYHEVRRVKRDVPQYSVQLVKALRDARLDVDAMPALERVVRDSAQEFTHLLLCTGITATDFRRNFRHGSAGYHVITGVQLAGRAALLGENLDGFSVLRMSKDQTWNVKQRWAKLRRADVLIHDPQGAHWYKLLAAMLDGQRDENVGLLADLRDRGVSLVAENAITGTQDAVEHAARNLVRHIRSWAENPPETMKWDDAYAARGAWTGLNERLRMGSSWYKHETPEDHRVEIEKALVVCEAFLDGKDVREAFYDPDTSGRHCSASRLAARIERVRAERSAWRRPEGA